MERGKCRSDFRKGPHVHVTQIFLKLQLSNMPRFRERRYFRTPNSLARDVVISLLQKSLRRKEKELAYQAAKELLLGNHLHWTDISTFLFEDHCLSNTDALNFIFEQYTRKGNQAKFSCIAMMLKDCKPCRLAPCMSSNTYEARQLTTETEETVTGLVEAEEGHVNVDIVLTELVHAWKNKQWDQLLAYMKVVATIVSVECHVRTVTEKGKKYILPTNTHPHVTLVVLSALYKNTAEKKMTDHLQTCYDLATFKPLSSLNLCLLLFSVVACYKHGFSTMPYDATEIPHWLDISDLKRKSIPEWAISIETSRIQSSGKRKEDNIERYLAEGCLSKEPAEIENLFALTFREMCLKFMKRRLNGTMNLALESHRRTLASNLVHGELQPINMTTKRDTLRKRKAVPKGEPPAKRKNITHVEKGEEVRGPYSDLLKMRDILFIHDSMLSVLKDAHTLPLYQRGTDCLVYPLVASGFHPMNMLPYSVIEALPHTVWVHFIYRYMFGLKDSSLHNAVMCPATGKVYGLGMEEAGLQLKETSIITDIMFSGDTKKRLLGSTLTSLKKHKQQILEQLVKQNPSHEIKSLALKYGVHFGETLFKKKMEQVVSLLTVL